MIKLIDIEYCFTIFYSSFITLLLILKVPTYAQQGSYSSVAQGILDTQNVTTEETSTSLDIFKFSVNDILNSEGIPTENSYGETEIFGRTDYGSEFALANDLSITSEIQIPAFVIDVLAEDENGEYLPIIVNGFSDEEDGNYIRSYTDDGLNAYVQETFNSDGPNVVSYQYDNRTEIQYLPDEGVTVTKNLFTDGKHSENYVEDSLRVYSETSSNGYSFTNYHDDSREIPIFAIDYNYVDGSTAFEINENGERYFQKTNSDNSTEFRYTEDLLEIGQNTQTGGNSINFITKTDEVGNTETIRQMVVPDGVITLEYKKNEAAISVSETYIRGTPIPNQDGTERIVYSGSTGDETHIIEEIITENGDSSFFIDGETFIENVGEVVSIADRTTSKDALIEQLQPLITEGEEVITESENYKNSNLRSIDFKDLYDEVNGQAITPEMGYVRLAGPEENQYINLSSGDVVEFFVRPTQTYLDNHNREDLFFIDRAVPENPVVTETDNGGIDYDRANVPSSPTEDTNNLGPGEEAVTLPSGEIKIYVTTVHVQAPASKFLPDQVVIPVESDGDYNYNVEPAPAKTFPDEVVVVAIPEDEAEVLSKKIKEEKRRKEESKNPKNDEDTPAALDAGIEAMKKLGIFLNDVQKGPIKLLSETKGNIQKEFPNISKELINLIINLADSDEKFDLIQDPKEFLDNEFSKLNDPQNLKMILSNNLSQKDLTKIYNLMVYKFSADLADLGFETLKNQEKIFSVDITSADQIIEQNQLQKDVMAIAPLLRPIGGSQALSNLLIEPVEIDPNSSEALFQSADSQKVLNRIKGFSNVINSINNGTSLINTTEGTTVENIPLIEINVVSGESVAEALEAKLAEDKRVNRNFQTRSQSSKLEKFDFDVRPQEANPKPSGTPPLLTEAATISDQELQLVAETTEAANNILDATINRMLTELGSTSIDTDTTQLISAANIQEQPDQQSPTIREDTVFGNALSSAQKLRQVEDIRAIFQILGIGS